ncbi:putative pentatricopeptide repeat-containing protein At1g12700, mitochondrial [Rosa rugosa]|uniref:putative pentatricopeptide repeat-containing protein At1g12700, mitochondrial n=1 Tax=Rosa rugosa TaxID=74645 RepID=UPI002B411DE3|nr:putative pentatricopeptide repeat-containing protein At1g12700, mitochondrial [Rosa rugosa]
MRKPRRLCEEEDSYYYQLKIFSRVQNAAHNEQEVCLDLLHSTTTTLDVYLALLHSQPSIPLKSRNTHLERPKVVSNVEDALKVFHEMLQRRPLPFIVRFTQILGQLVKMKHYSDVIALYDQIFFVLAQFFKFGLEPNVTTFTTLINGFLLCHRVAEATQIFRKMVDGGNCKPDVVTFGTLIKALCIKGNNTAAIQLLRKMEQSPDCKPNLVVYSTIIDSLYVHTFTVLVDTLCKEGMAVEAKGVIEMMVQRDIESDKVTYN